MRQIGARDEGEADRRLRLVRAPALLHDLVAGLRAHFHQDGEAAEPESQPLAGCPACAAGSSAACATSCRTRRASSSRGCAHEGSCSRTGSCGGGSSSGLRFRLAAPAAAASRRRSVCSHASAPASEITTGDPAGIGPEVAAKAAADPSVREVWRAGCSTNRASPAGFQPGVVLSAAGRARARVPDSSCGPRGMRWRNASTAWPPLPSTRGRGRAPGCAGADIPSCSRS